MQLYSPLALLLLLIIPVLGWLMLRKKREAAVTFSSLNAVRSCPVSWRVRLRPLLVAARLACLVLLIIALARPRKGTVLSEVSTEGVAIEILVDHSSSMGTEMDYYGQKLNRLETLKKVLADFVMGKEGLAGRGGDLLGLVTFARYPDTICPLVLSHNVLLEFLKNTDIVRLRSEDGTAIGDAIALAAARLQTAEQEIQERNRKLNKAGLVSTAEKPDFKIKSKAIILLTDGQNNRGEYSPMQAAEMAKKWGIKIYTIGIGSGQAFATIQTMMGAIKMPVEQDLDEPLLKAIAEATGGFYGRADDADALHKIMEKIDKLEKTEVKSVQYTQYAEKFGPWTQAAVIILLCEILAGCTIFRKIP